MAKYLPADAVATISEGAPPDTGEATNEALGSFPAIPRSLVRLFATGSLVGDADGEDTPGGGAHSEGHIEAWDGTAWQPFKNPDETDASESITVGRAGSDGYNNTGPFHVDLAITDLSDVKVRVRGDCTTSTGGSSSTTDDNITDWYAILRRRSQPQLV